MARTLVDPGYRCPYCHAAFYVPDGDACPWCSGSLADKRLAMARAYGEELPVWAGEQPILPKGKNRKSFPRWKPAYPELPPFHLAKKSLPTIPLKVRVFERDEHRCVFCNAKAELTLDHIIPRSRGGSNHFDNLQAACAPCNRRKANHMPGDARWPRGFVNVRPGRARWSQTGSLSRGTELRRRLTLWAAARLRAIDARYEGERIPWASRMRWNAYVRLMNRWQR